MIRLQVKMNAEDTFLKLVKDITSKGFVEVIIKIN